MADAVEICSLCSSPLLWGKTVGLEIPPPWWLCQQGWVVHAGFEGDRSVWKDVFLSLCNQNS